MHLFGQPLWPGLPKVQQCADDPRSDLYEWLPALLPPVNPCVWLRWDYLPRARWGAWRWQLSSGQPGGLGRGGRVSLAGTVRRSSTLLWRGSGGNTPVSNPPILFPNLFTLSSKSVFSTFQHTVFSKTLIWKLSTIMDYFTKMLEEHWTH